MLIVADALELADVAAEEADELVDDVEEAYLDISESACAPQTNAAIGRLTRLQRCSSCSIERR